MPAPPPTEISAITNPDWEPTVASVAGRFVEASNATLLCETTHGEPVIYKPIAGARPLWDFDAATLALREVWTCRIDRALGLDVVPETVLADGPFGPGAVQRHVDGVADEEVVHLINSADPSIWPVAVLDLVINNADRKVGHILRQSDGRLWAIDHGLTFHPEDKLRTVLWGFAGATLPSRLLSALGNLAAALDGELGRRFVADFGRSEFTALTGRISAVLHDGVHPQPPEHRPAIPWPPY